MLLYIKKKTPINLIIMGTCKNFSAEIIMLWYRKGTLVTFIFKDFLLLGYISNDKIFLRKNI